MMLYPLVNMFRVSMLDWRGILKESSFSGLENYVKLFTEDKFFDALRNTAVLVSINLPLVVFGGFFLGFWLTHQRPWVTRILRVLFFSPVMIAPPGKALIFMGVYHPQGILNQLLATVGLEGLTRTWLNDPATALAAVQAIDLWGGIGFYTVLFFAVLSNVPAELYEAAKLDGADTWQIMRHIAFPLILSFVGVALTLHFMWLLLGISQNILLLTQGGPGTSSTTLGYYLYREAFMIKRLGYSQAIGVVIFAIGMTGMVIIRRLTHRTYQF
jgi:multiple sugar transport system permease protein